MYFKAKNDNEILNAKNSNKSNNNKSSYRYNTRKKNNKRYSKFYKVRVNRYI